MTKQRTPAQERRAKRRYDRAVAHLDRVYRHWQPTPAFFAEYRKARIEMEAARIDLWEGKPPALTTGHEHVLERLDRMMEQEEEAP